MPGPTPGTCGAANRTVHILTLCFREKQKELKSPGSQEDSMSYCCSEQPGEKTNAVRNKAMELAHFLLSLHCIG